ncbi:sugar ABC transporter ATP-binding protein [Mesorhizobium sp. BAC0120]|uniref:sugar ABC transporter ATP-binding protein n=1 Tax=Mesorhizobium sp. BAC0120 TaxID=3090670 RepID=UPI00298CCE6B|nr:sugar ABC transporter ATP-binding protein [Mesorhizobium sp. BAC0120]MDW6021712.1 sugar ABC transporter ATP-binding protein [Mesorhizobium sp. BAC0120]
MPLFSVTNVSKAYSGVPALIDASLELEAGEVHALMGENGAGKSTLIKILAGVVEPDSCAVTLDRRRVRLDSPQNAFEHGLRFIHQELNVVPQLSVAENMFLGQRYPTRFGAFVDWKAINAQATAALERLRISGIKPGRKMARLSTGDQMLVRIAGTLVADPSRPASIFVMDEPTAALSSEESERLFAVIGELRAAGCAVLYVSHRMDEVMRISDRVTIMRDGRTVKTMAIAATDRREIIQLMTGRDVGEAFPPRRGPIEDSVALDVRSLASEHVSGISFSLRKGEILGVAGLANAGQSELMRAIIGADAQRSHHVALDGSLLPGLSPGAAWRRGFAYVPRERRKEGLVLSRSVTDNVTLPHLAETSLLSVFLDRRRERAVAGDLGRQVRLKAARLSQLCRHLSGGNQQKVVFARAMAGRPAILLLDEPTRGVDVGARFDIYTLMRELSEAGTSILMSSSDLPELLGLCDRILIMRDGRQLTIEPAAGLSQAELLHLFHD